MKYSPACLSRLFTASALLIFLGCTGASIESSPDQSGGGGEGGSGGSPELPPPNGRECPAEETITLTRQQYDGETIALYVPVEVEGEAGLLHLDSASSSTLLFAPEVEGWVDNYAQGSLGCRERSFPGYGGLGTLPDVGGLPVVGMGGADLFLAEPVMLDVDGARFVRNPSDVSLVDNGVDLQYEVVLGEYVVNATLDGDPKLLILDTGASHTVWVDETPRPDEIEIVTEDALGNPLFLYQSTVVLGVGGGAYEVTLLRAPVFDIVEQISEQMGIQIDGLIGLSALNALYSDEVNGVLRAAL